MRGAVACLLVTLFASALHVQTAFALVIPATGRGWYLETGDSNPGDGNYAVGDVREGGGPADVRNFFVFDLSEVVLSIQSAGLVLYVPSRTMSDAVGYVSNDPSEVYELHDVVTPISKLLDGFGGVAAHNDLGSGVIYGGRTFTAEDVGSVVEITLNGAAIDAMNSSTGLFALGGSITTLDDVPDYEVLFGGTEYGPSKAGSGGSDGNSLEYVQLRLSLVPEPSSVVLLCVAGIFATPMRRRRASTSCCNS